MGYDYGAINIEGSMKEGNISGQYLGAQCPQPPVNGTQIQLPTSSSDGGSICSYVTGLFSILRCLSMNSRFCIGTS